MSGSASGSILVFKERQPPRFRTTKLTQQSLHDFCSTDAWQRNIRVKLVGVANTSFACDVDYLDPDELKQDSVHQSLTALNLGWQLGLMVPMPTGDMAVYTFERFVADGRHEQDAVDRLNRLVPHLSRVGLLSARLGLERARNAVSTLEVLGLPAAVLSHGGHVRAVNAPLEALADVFLPAARGRMTIADSGANLFFQKAIEASDHLATEVRSFPVPRPPGEPALVLHVLPLVRAAHEIFANADILVVVTTVSTSTMLPTPELLHGLFDLTPAEAKLAVALSAGKSLRQAAAEQNIQYGTARSYVERTLQKTGTRQQSELVTLLKSAKPFP